MTKKEKREEIAFADADKALIRRLRQKVARYERRYEMTSPALFRRLDSGDVSLTAELDEWRQTCCALKSRLGEVDNDGVIVWLDDDEKRWKKREDARIRARVKKGNSGFTTRYTTAEARERYLRRRLARFEQRYEMSSAELVRKFDNDEIRPTTEIVDWYHNSYALKFLLERTRTTGTPSKTIESSMKTG